MEVASAAASLIIVKRASIPRHFRKFFIMKRSKKKKEGQRRARGIFSARWLSSDPNPQFPIPIDTEKSL